MRARVLTVTTVLATVLAGLGATQIASAGAEPTGEEPTAAPAARRPNIVLIAVDDMSARDLRAMPITRQLIGDRGVQFVNSFSPFPLCCPARASMLTGQYAHNHGVLGNDDPAFPEGGYGGFTSDENTIATWLDHAGYQTAFVGKYLNHYGDHGNAARVPPGWDDWHGTLSGGYRVSKAFQNDGTVHTYDKYRSAWTTDTVVKIIRHRIGRPAPLMVTAWHYAPHAGHPTEPDDPEVVYGKNIKTPVPARRDKDTFRGTPVPKDPSFNEANVSDKPSLINKRPRLSRTDVRALTELHQQRLETLQNVDQGVGDILQALRRSGELDNTVVAFTSDNGYMIGQHRVLQGKVLPYEAAIRTPLLIRGPGIPQGKVRRQLVGTMDLTATFVDAAHAKPRRTLDGASLLNLIHKPHAREDRDIVIEAGPHKVGGKMTFIGLRTEHYTYVEYATGERELYNLDRDPYELKNLIGSPSVRRTLVRKLSRQLHEMRNCKGAECRVATRY